MDSHLFHYQLDSPYTSPIILFLLSGLLCLLPFVSSRIIRSWLTTFFCVCESVCACMCVCVSEREREREREEYMYDCRQQRHNRNKIHQLNGLSSVSLSTGLTLHFSNHPLLAIWSSLRHDSYRARLYTLYHLY